MIRDWPEALEAAEQAALRRRPEFPVELAEWVAARIENGEAPDLPPAERAHLAVLARHLGRPDLGRRLLHGAEQAELRLLSGVLAASEPGGAAAAADEFETALYTAADDLTRAKAMANLAALAIGAGDLERAERRAASARRVLAESASAAPAVALLLATTAASLARTAGDRRRLRSATDELAEASRECVAELDRGDPRSYLVLGNLAAFELDLARMDASPERMSRAAEVLEIAVGGIAAVFGRDHPDALVALTSLGAAELELACADGESGERIAHAAVLLDEAAERYAAIYPPDHPAVLGGRINCLLAMLEVARVRRDGRLFENTTGKLARKCRALAEAMGEGHPAAILAMADLGTAQLDLARTRKTDEAIRESAWQAVRTLEAVAANAARTHGELHPVTTLARRELLAAQSLAQGDSETDAYAARTGVGVAVSVRSATAVGWFFDSRFLQFDLAARRAATTTFTGLRPPAVPRSGMTVDEIGSEEEFLAAIDETIKYFNDGDIVEGTVVKVDRDEVLLDIGYKTEGVIPPQELSIKRDVDPHEVVSVGDHVEALVLQKEDKEGRLILSKRRAQYERAWARIEKIENEGGVVTGTVIEVVKGGLILDIGLRGFLPASLVEMRRVRDLQPYVGRELHAKIIELDKNRNTVVLSRRAWLEQTQSETRAAFLATVHKGQIRTGVVSSIVNFGAFVDLGGVDGLVHLSELSWKHIGHPSEVVEVGQEITVEVLDVDLERERVSLSFRATQEDPWHQFARTHQIGQIIPGLVMKLVPFGAFVRVEEGIEGLVHVSELAERHVEVPEEVVRVGDEIFVKVVDIDIERRRISLSLKQANEAVDLADFDPTLYGMPAEYDENGDYEYPEGFDAETGEWLPGFDEQREAWDREYADAWSRFEAHRRQIEQARRPDDTEGDA